MLDFGDWGRPANRREKSALRRGDLAGAAHYHADHWTRSAKLALKHAEELRALYFPNGNMRRA